MPQLVDNRYRIVRPLGSGGMAEVYLAHDDVLDRDVALKILNSSYSDDEEFVERFRREAQSAAALAHPNIVSIFDRGESGDDQDTYYIAMEYLPGGSLKDRINSRGALPARTAAEVALQIAEALKTAHEKDLVHRDIKPHNILVTETGDLKVTDFGIARAATSTTMTRTGSVMGTAHYISPEQAMGEPAGPQSDLYSLGVVLYEMLTGELPFDAETPIGIAMKHVNESPAPPGELDGSIPEGLDAITLRLMSKDPEDRYPDESELIRDLQNVVGGHSPSEATTMVLDGAAIAGAAGVAGSGNPASTERNPAERTLIPDRPGAGVKRRSKVVPLVMLGVLALLALVGWGAYNMIPEPPPTAQVPELEGLSLDEARGNVGENFSVSVSERRDSGEPEDTILEQDPSPGGQLEQGSDISVAVSGQQVVEVPDVVGEPRGEAESTLSDEGFEVSVEREESSADEEGTVVSQNPSAGNEADFESEVAITVGSGPSDVETPDLSGMSVSEAESELSDADLELGEESETASDEVDEGDIVEQTPEAGSGAEPGSAVDVTVSTGPEPASVPSLYGYNRANAEAALEDAGLSLGEVARQNTGELAEGLILSQSVAGGVEVEPGTEVDVTISSGPAPVSVPDVIGDQIIDAQRELQGIGLGYTTQGVQSDEPAGAVLSTDPGAGAEVDPGTQISISYSLGQPDTASAPAPTPAPTPTPASEPAPDTEPDPAPVPVSAPDSSPDEVPDAGESADVNDVNNVNDGGDGSGNDGQSTEESSSGEGSSSNTDGSREGGGSGDGESSGGEIQPPDIEEPELPDIEQPEVPDL